MANWDPSHMWYYMPKERGGDGGRPLTVSEITADVEVTMTPSELHTFEQCYPIRKTGQDTLTKRIDRARSAFEQSKRAYEHLVKSGIKAVSEFDIEICAQGDEDQALATALFLRHNHVAYDWHHLKVLESMRDGGVQLCFGFRV